MFLSNAAVRRPVAMSCLIIALSLLGLNSYRKMGLEIMPEVDIPVITIMTIYPGATPEEIETDIARRIEDEVVAISGLRHVNSVALENVCQTILEFEIEVDVDIAAMDVRERLDLIRDDFPDDVEDPIIMKFDVNAVPVLSLALVGDAPLDELYDYADNELSDRITVIPGVANVEITGGAERQVHIRTDRDKLAARGLTSMDIVQAVQEGVRTIPSGRIRAQGMEYTVTFDADFRELDLIGELQVAGLNGQRTYVKDVAEVVMTTEEVRQAAMLDGRPGVSIRVVKRAEANAVRVVDDVYEAMEELRDELPGGMELVWVTDDGIFTRAMADSAWINIIQGIFLTALILFFFLYNIRSTLVIAVTMPLTIVIGLFFMEMVGFTLNAITLMAIGMSVGILVTNSIVVLESIVKQIEKGKPPAEAARLGANAAFIAVLASAGTNVVVLFPLSIMPGMVGVIMGPFAMTLVIVTVVSLFISFTLTPLLCSLILKPKKEGSRSPLAIMERLWNRNFERIVRLYQRLLQFSERHRAFAALFLIGVVLVFMHSMMMAGRLGSSMGQDPDRGEVLVKLEFPTHYSLQRTHDQVTVIEEDLRDLPHLRHILTSVGNVEGMIGQASEGVNLAQMMLRFNERTDRTESLDELMEIARRKLANYPGVIATLAIANVVGGQASDVEFEIYGPDLDVLDRLALEAEAAANDIPGFRDPDTTTRQGKPELRIRPNRAVLADLGFPPVHLGMALRGNIEGITAGTFKRDERNYDIVVKFAEKDGAEQVSDFLFPGAPGRPISLTNIGEVEETLTPVQITRKNKQRISKFFANLEPTLPLGTAAELLSEAFEEHVDLAGGYSYDFGGIYEIMEEAFEALAEALIIAVILVILMLAAILESFKQPILILVTLPLALIGVIYALLLGGYSLSIFVMLGIVMMTGIVVNNAILIMDQFNVYVTEGMPRHKAMVNAAGERFRPIAMITLAAILGMLPLALGRGIGAELRNDIGVASVGGILVSGLLTLFVMPILYDFFTRRQKNNGMTPAPATGDTAKKDAAKTAATPAKKGDDKENSPKTGK